MLTDLSVHGSARGGRVTARLVGLVLAGGLGAAPGSAAGQSLSVTSRSVYNGYQVQLQPLSEDGGVRQLNRLYQWVDLGAFGLVDAIGDVDVVASFRYDTDFGTGFNRDTPMTAGIPAVDGRHDLDLLYLYIDWQNVVPDILDVRVGRQLILDTLTWYSLDGVTLTVHPWSDGASGLDVALYAGVPVRFDALFSSSPFIADGFEVKDSTGFFHGVAFGGNADLRLFGDLTMSVAYRQELKLRDDDLQAFRGLDIAAEASAGSVGLRESRIGGSLGYTLRALRTNLYASAIWDALLGNLEQARAGAAWNPISGVHVQGEYLRVRPRFAGDSIFNYFNIFGYDRGRLEAGVELIDGLEVHGGYLLQVFGGDPVNPPGSAPGEDLVGFAGSDLSHGPMGGASYRGGIWGIGFDIEAATNTGGEYAYGGNYRMMWMYGDVSFWERRITLDGRLSLTTFQNDWFEDADEGAVADPDTTFITTIGGRARITDWMRARVVFAKNFSAYLAGSYRVYSELALTY